MAVRIAFLGAAIVALLALLLLRLWFLQVIGGEQYARAAENNRLREVVLDAPRGIIEDRKGRVIVGNRAGQNVVLIPQELEEGPRRERVLRRLSRVLRKPVPELHRIIERAKAANLPPYQSIVLAEDVPPPIQRYLAERKRDFPGISLKETFVREYPHGELAAQVLGYVGPIPAEREKEYLRRGYHRGEKVGIGGIEQQYESYLRGTPGRLTVEVDAAGEPVGRGVLSVEQPKQGRTLRLSIDIDVQRGLEAALREAMARTAYSTGAAGVVLDPRTGEVLAMASYPTFNPSIFADNDARRISRVFRDESRPLLNRAVDGLYPAASTFKVVTATAGLETPKMEPVVDPSTGDVKTRGGITADEGIWSPGVREFYGTEFEGFGRVSHGTITVRTALEVSSDTFFYEIGNRFYNMGAATPLQDWARRYGLDEPLGIDLPSESGGVVPDRAYLQQAFAGPQFSDLQRSWRPGNSISLSIGQGNLLVTPLQMASVYATIANGGTIRTPTIGRQVRTVAGTVERDLLKGRPSRELGAKPETIRVLKDGLFLAANGAQGTSTSVFRNVPQQFEVAGKTGTAENESPIDHSWWVGYAPYFAPEIVVGIIVERGGTGAGTAAPAACRTMAAYFRYDPGLCGVASPDAVN